MKQITTVIFDLDGTLLNTLDDLSDSVNYALRNASLPERTLNEVRSFVGNGVRLLMERAVPEGANHPDFEQIFSCFKEHYVIHCRQKTCLYDGVDEMLKCLKAKGYKIGIVSNKLQAGVDELYDLYFHDTVQVAVGERAGVARKPAADMVHIALNELGSTADEAVYVGDSDVDLATAVNSGLPCIAVLWGFRDRDFLMQHGATCLASHPEDVVKHICDGSF